MDELFEDEFELEFEELFEDEFEDEFELEFDELLEDEFELELLDEFELELDELLPATMIVPSVWSGAWLVCLDEPSPSPSIRGCSLASAAEPTIAAKPAASAVFIQILVMSITPHLNRVLRSGGVTGDVRLYSIAKLFVGALTCRREDRSRP